MASERDYSQSKRFRSGLIYVEDDRKSYIPINKGNILTKSIISFTGILTVGELRVKTIIKHICTPGYADDSYSHYRNRQQLQHQSLCKIH